MSINTGNFAWTVPDSATSINHLTLDSLPVPTAGPHQVLVRLTAVSLNYRDLLVATRSPEYPGNHVAGLVPCCDGAGMIHATGVDSEWTGREGTRVILHPNEWMTGDVRNLDLTSLCDLMAYYTGVLQQWIAVDDARLIEAPTHLSSVECASLPTAGVTAWSAIRELLDASLAGELGDWRDGQRLQHKTILTQGTGGVSYFAIQIAAALGATVLATSSSDKKIELAKALGATHGINYTTTPDWDREVLRLTDGKGVDQVIELGGARTLLKSVNSVRKGGLVSLIGILSAPQDVPADIIPSLLFGSKIVVKGCVAFSRDATAEFARFAEQHGVRPVVAKEFRFNDAVEAFEALQNQTEVGKIVINISNQ
ncbi:putative alcohol dehydrogenase [Didymella exigua CBS 183.55]|uniref:Putative alcohol dehydrogenase n=1 Tax=Didymella exigua CBS 183.55 TaxID=1150837 RepID=A0A6A5R4Z2_9PLEO|nr:putative alcohol dehydrogenase [Didymella exigua CBS 183.55]KAF1922772.1 putative alcohol dehydrogenase [Didymella exigua CBS 183.55]